MAINKFQSPLTNPHFINVWRNACNKTAKQNPNDDAALYLRSAFEELNILYAQPASNVSNSLQRRHEIFECFSKAGKLGDPRGMFFEGLALQGFGCEKDLITSAALIRVAAFARDCDLAIQFLMLRLGHTHLFSTTAQHKIDIAIKCFKQAGDIAKPELNLIAQHLKSLRSKLVAKPEHSVGLEHAPRVSNVLRMY